MWYICCSSNNRTTNHEKNSQKINLAVFDQNKLPPSCIIFKKHGDNMGFLKKKIKDYFMRSFFNFRIKLFFSKTYSNLLIFHAQVVMNQRSPISIIQDARCFVKSIGKIRSFSHDFQYFLHCRTFPTARESGQSVPCRRVFPGAVSGRIDAASHSEHSRES